MFKKIKNINWKPNFLSKIKESQKEGARFLFILSYENLIIGKLCFEQENWKFEYSKDFCKQDTLNTLTAFPKKEKQYTSPKLWSFFASRIPSLKQRKVKEYLAKNKQKADIVHLLKEFGTRTITNPFILKEKQ